MTTTRELVQTGAERLRAAGSETPRLDAELLLAHAIGVDRTTIVAHAEAPVGPAAEEAYLGYVTRRAAGEPVAYLRGFKEFHGIALGVDPRALIPRPETEALVDLSLVEIMARLTSGPPAGSGRDGRLRVVDVGTGSGAVVIAIAVALRRRRVPPVDVELVGVDVSPEALDLARENAVGHAVADRISFVGADLLPPASMSQPRDVVVANLPYIRTDALATLPSPTAFEPPIALDGGTDGLAVIARLLERLPTTLAATGVAFVEIGADQRATIADRVTELLPGWSCAVETDLAGLARVATIRRGAV
jgi:release factor glutamine methyltransferase